MAEEEIDWDEDDAQDHWRGAGAQTGRGGVEEDVISLDGEDIEETKAKPQIRGEDMSNGTEKPLEQIVEPTPPPAPPSQEDLPEGWAAVMSNTHQRVFYFHRGSNTTVWDKPEATSRAPVPPPSPPVSEPAPVLAPASALAPIPLEEKKEPATDVVAAEKKKEPEIDAVATAYSARKPRPENQPPTAPRSKERGPPAEPATMRFAKERQAIERQQAIAYQRRTRSPGPGGPGGDAKRFKVDDRPDLGNRNLAMPGHWFCAPLAFSLNPESHSLPSTFSFPVTLGSRPPSPSRPSRRSSPPLRSASHYSPPRELVHEVSLSVGGPTTKNTRLTGVSHLQHRKDTPAIPAQSSNMAPLTNNRWGKEDLAAVAAEAEAAKLREKAKLAAEELKRIEEELKKKEEEVKKKEGEKKAIEAERERERERERQREQERRNGPRRRLGDARPSEERRPYDGRPVGGYDRPPGGFESRPPPNSLERPGPGASGPNGAYQRLGVQDRYTPSEPRDRPAEPRDRQLDARDRPLSSRDRPVNPRDRLFDPRDRPFDGRDRPLNIRDRPFDARDGRSDGRDRPLDARDRPLDARDRPLDARDRPLDARDRPLAPRDQPVDFRDRPMEPRDRPPLRDRPSDLRDRPTFDPPQRPTSPPHGPRRALSPRPLSARIGGVVPPLNVQQRGYRSPPRRSPPRAFDRPRSPPREYGRPPGFRDGGLENRGANGVRGGSLQARMGGRPDHIAEPMGVQYDRQRPRSRSPRPMAERMGDRREDWRGRRN